MNQDQPFQILVDDTINYKVYVSKAVPLGDVTVTAHIDMLLSGNDESQSVEDKIQSALNDFIPASWTIVDQDRRGATPGYEKISLKAIANVPVTENTQLEERAAKANRKGLEITHVSARKNLPQETVNQMIKALWFDVIERVNTHIKEYDRVSQRTWRIGDIVLGVPGGGSRTRLTKGGSVEEGDQPLGSFMESGLSGVEKVSLTADVTLKSSKPVSL